MALQPWEWFVVFAKWERFYMRLPASASIFKLAGNQSKEGLEVMHRCTRLLNWIDLVTCFHDLSWSFMSLCSQGLCLCSSGSWTTETWAAARLESQGPKSRVAKSNICLSILTYYALLVSIHWLYNALHCVCCSLWSMQFLQGLICVCPCSQCGWAQLFWETWQLTTAHRVAACSFKAWARMQLDSSDWSWLCLLPRANTAETISWSLSSFSRMLDLHGSACFTTVPYHVCLAQLKVISAGSGSRHLLI